MKLKYKIVFLSCIFLLLLVFSFSALIVLQKGKISENIPAVDILNTLLWRMFNIGLIILIIATILAWLAAKNLSDPIVKITSIAKQIAMGDLSSASNAASSLVMTESPDRQRFSDDEIQHLLIAIKSMTQTLNSLVGHVQRSGIQVASSANELSEAARQQETNLSVQMNSMENVQKSVEEIFNIADVLANSMHHVASISQETAEFANSGQTDLLRMMDVIDQMGQASAAISIKLEAINQKADNITTVVETITKVADQTNLLSLSAAIEAEKAGEFGRGFTVVAREIRRLADQTALAILDIEQVVKEMRSAVSAGVVEMDKFIVEVQNSVENVEKIRSQLTRIIRQVQALSPDFDNVSEAMDYQSQNAQKINNAMLNLGEEMKQTMESLRDSYVAIAQLNDATGSLRDGVARFEVSLTILDEIEIFRPFSDEAKSYLNQHMHSRHFTAGETIIKQGDPGDSLFIIAKGLVGIWVQFEDGKSVEVTQRSAGDVVGEMALLTGEARTASLICITDTHVFEITKEDIAPFIEKQPEITKLLGEILTVRKLEIEAKKNLHQSQRINEEQFYKQTLQKIQSFFGLR